jgi:hypothetical protein
MLLSSTSGYRPGSVGDHKSSVKRLSLSIITEMVPRLLAHLDIAHVSIASHSGGDIYLMNTILTYPQLLHPESPYVCFFAPWVHFSHSRMPHLLATGLLPASLIGKFGALGKFVNENVIPVVDLSGSLVTGFKASLLSADPPPPIAPATSTTTPARELSNGSLGNPQDIDLNDPKVVDQVRTLITKFVFAENVDGVSADTQLFLKRSVSWRSASIDWSDFDYAVQLLPKIISEDNRLQGSNRTWAIDCFHAENDQMVGEKGKQWFNDIWVPHQSYEYRCCDVEGTEHNFLLDPAFGASEMWLRRVSEAWQTSGSDGVAP